MTDKPNELDTTKRLYQDFIAAVYDALALRPDDQEIEALPLIIRGLVEDKVKLADVEQQLVNEKSATKAAYHTGVEDVEGPMRALLPTLTATVQALELGYSIAPGALSHQALKRAWRGLRGCTCRPLEAAGLFSVEDKRDGHYPDCPSYIVGPDGPKSEPLDPAGPKSFFPTGGEKGDVPVQMAGDAFEMHRMGIITNGELTKELNVLRVAQGLDPLPDDAAGDPDKLQTTKPGATLQEKLTAIRERWDASGASEVASGRLHINGGLVDPQPDNTLTTFIELAWRKDLDPVESVKAELTRLLTTCQPESMFVAVMKAGLTLQTLSNALLIVDSDRDYINVQLVLADPSMLVRTGITTGVQTWWHCPNCGIDRSVTGAVQGPLECVACKAAMVTTDPP